jgi:predicted nuclease with TOPRIM domain
MESESRRQALYAGLTDVLGPDLTASLMSFLPFQPTADLATRADIEDLSGQIAELDNRLGARIDELDNRLGSRIDELDNRLGARIDELDSRLGGRIDHLTDRVDHLSDRMDRLQTTLLGGFAAMIAALLATGFLA